MSGELAPQYDPQSTESAIYQKWLDAGVFHAVPDEREPARRFSMVIPPPNVTGALHLGHAINGTIQDILARYHRMRGDNTLWMPGIDHAGIATQAVVERTIFEQEKKSRHDLGRDELVRRIWEWKEKFGDRILSQLQSIGASCDWDRTRFTLDEQCARAVREAFFKMFKDGLIFRGKRLVNWDTHLQTAVADDEIYYESIKGQLTSIKYPLADDPTTFLIVATTRPETMLGDTALAVHPDDPRYQHLIGKNVIVPLVGRSIPIVGDGLLVDPKFGTGVVKVTPAHDPNDYATGLRHGLDTINLLTPDGRVNENGAGEFRGTPYSYTGLKFASAARQAVLKDLEALDLIAEKKPYEHEVGHSDRSKTPIEPYLSDQWFVRMGDSEDGITLANGQPVSGLAQAAMDAVREGRVKITPERYAKGYLDWLGQKRDWCISRQLWWGHRIPVWSKHYETKQEFWGAPGSQQDEDHDHLTSLAQIAESIAIFYVDDADETNTFRSEPPRGNGFTVLVCTPSEIVRTAFAGVDDEFDMTEKWKLFRETLKGDPRNEELQDAAELGGFPFADAFLDSTSEYIKQNRDEFAEIARDPANKQINIEELLRRSGFTQDPDVLDTWFSSALWPLSTMGWPGASDLAPSPRRPVAQSAALSDRAPCANDALLDYFYPTSALSTARDILTLWVARMVMFGLYCRGAVPFRDVYIHATIQDGEGRTMSKSKGNGVDPVDIIQSHGADALRFTLASMATETQDIRMPVVKDPTTGRNTSPRFDIGRNFANKIWNASRFILGNIEAAGAATSGTTTLPAAPTELADRWILSRLNATIRAAEEAINAFHFADYAQALYSFFWTDLCDWYLEISKARIKAGDAAVGALLRHCLQTALRLLHPMMPFITEELWSKLPAAVTTDPAGKPASLLAAAAWPAADPARFDPTAEAQIAVIQAITSSIREIQNRYPAAKGKSVILKPHDAAMRQTIAQSRLTIESLAGVTIAENSLDATRPTDAAVAVLPAAEIYIADVIDKEAETKTLTKRQAELRKFIAGHRQKLSNESFVSKAPEKIVQGLRDQLAQQEEELATVEQNLADLAQ